MLGIIVGTVGAFVTARWVARAIWWRRMRRMAFAMGPGAAYGWYGHRAHGGHPHGGHHKGWYAAARDGEGGTARGFRGSALYRVFERLDATPAQERAIRSAIEKLDAQAVEGRNAQSEAQKAIAAALRSEVLTPESLQDLYVAHAKRLDGVRDAVAATINEVHAALDTKQREVLAQAIEAGELDLGLGALFGTPAQQGPGASGPFVRGYPHAHGFGRGMYGPPCA